MEEKLVITSESMPGFLLLRISGRIDGYWSKHLDESLENALRGGDHNIALDLENVGYLSSLGIRIFVKYIKLFKSVGGSFGISKLSTGVQSVLEMVGMDSMLKWNEPQKKTVETESPTSTSKEVDGFNYKTISLAQTNEDIFLKYRFIGNPDKVFDNSFSEADVKTIRFGKGKYGIGLGAIGPNYKDCQGRFGEFAAFGDSLAYMQSGKINSPDYMLSSGSLIPEINLLYGVLFEGEFSRFIRITPHEINNRAPLSSILKTISDITQFESFAVIMVAMSAGIVGASLIKSPVEKSDAENAFGYPQVKEMVNFTTEPEYRGEVALNIGIVTKSKNEEIAKFTRPLKEDSDLRQHIHSAIFRYIPLSKADLNLNETVSALFEDDKIESVLHLLNDQREAVGIGESEFLQGVCWVGELIT